MKFAACFHYPAINVAGNQTGRQRGAALVLALLIVALVAAIAVELTEEFQINVARVENRWYGATAQNYLEGAEALAGIVLQQDLVNSEVDTLQEEWAQSVPPFPTDDGMLTAQLEDAQGRFNLNNLDGDVEQQGTPQTPAQRFTPQQRQFIRLLQTFEDYDVAEHEAIAIAESVIDWIDRDDEPRGFGGAESLFYSNEQPPYEPNNTGKFHSVSELRLVRHMTPELYKRLEPWLVVLPRETGINVNTAPAHILRILNNQEDLSPLGAEDIQPLVEDRELQQYEAPGDFFSSPVLQNLAPNVTQTGFGVTSEFFLLHARATVGERERFLTSLLERTDENVKPVQRRYTSY